MRTCHSVGYRSFAVIMLVVILGASVPVAGFAPQAVAASAEAASLPANPEIFSAPAPLAETFTNAGTVFAETEAALQSGAADFMPDALANPLAVTRIQSTYSADGAMGNSLLMTFTVANLRPPAAQPEIADNATLTDTLEALLAVDYAQDPHTLRNVLLVDTLLPAQAMLLDASPLPDRDGETLAWQLGDVPPLGTVTATVRVQIPAGVGDFTPLDTGATAWGVLQGRMVSASATPAMLSPDGFGDWLRWTVDADYHDEYMIRQAAALGNDWQQLFAYVRALEYESYQGSLRGTRGTLWSGAGNSLDQASLLIAMLRGSGIPARYRHGTLSEERARALIATMFTLPEGVLGFVPDSEPTFDPVQNPNLLAETQDHWWVEAYVPGAGWTDLDPSFAAAQPGQSFYQTLAVDGTDRIPEVPDALRHKVNLRIRVETYNPLNFGGVSPGLGESYPLTYTLNAVELTGKPVFLQHMRNSTSAVGMVFYYVQHTYTPYLRIGDSDTLIMGHPFIEMLTNFPFGTLLLTGEWLEITLRAPDGTEEVQERNLYDLIGYDARENGGNLTLNLTGRGMDPGLSELTSYAMLFASSDVVPEAVDAQYQRMVAATLEAQAALDGVQDLLVTEDPVESDMPRLRRAQEALGEVGRVTQEAHLLTFAALSDFGRDRLERTYFVKAYPDTPRIFMTSWEWNLEEQQGEIRFDLRRDQVRHMPYPGQTQLAWQAFNYSRGVLETALEATVLEMVAPGPVISVQTVFDAAAEQDIPLTIVAVSNLSALDELDISEEAKARILEALRDDPMKFVVVPSSAVTVGDTTTVGWLLIDGVTGETVDVMEDGQHQALVSYELSLSWSVSGSPGHNACWGIIGFFHGFASYGLAFLGHLMGKMPFGETGIKTAWSDAMKLAEDTTKEIMDKIGIIGDLEDCLPIPDLMSGWIGAYSDGDLFTASLEFKLNKKISWSTPFGAGETEEELKIPGWVNCALSIVNVGTGVDVPTSVDYTIQVPKSGFKNGVHFAGAMIASYIDPPLPQAWFAELAPVPPVQNYAALTLTVPATLAGQTLSATLVAPYFSVSGPVAATWESQGRVAARFTDLATAQASLFTPAGTLLGSGALAAHAPDGVAQLTGAGVQVTASGAIRTAFYAPATVGLSSAPAWQTYTAQLTASQPYTLALSPAVVTLGGTETYTGAFTVNTALTTTLAGDGHALAALFTSEATWNGQAVALQIAPASGTATLDGALLDVAQGLAIANYTGTLETSAAGPALNALTLSGDAALFTLNAVPATSTTDPATAVTFQAQVTANFSDTYALSVAAPVGWGVAISGSGEVTAQPPVGARPGDYTLLVMAQSLAYPALVLSAYHHVTVTEYNGVVVDVAPDPLFTVPWGFVDPNGASDDTNSGQIQLSGAAYTLHITNTSTVSHTFQASLADLPTGWGLFNGIAGQTQVTLTLAPAAVGQVGLYISPTLTQLPPPGTPYPFSVQVMALDAPGLTGGDADSFIVPAIAFNFLHATPALAYAAPSGTASFTATLTNVGNVWGEFPFVVALPGAGWALATAPVSPVGLNPGEVYTQLLTLDVPDVPIGDVYTLRLISPTPGTSYTQTTRSYVEIVSPHTLAIYDVSKAVIDILPEAAPCLSPALHYLGFAINNLERTCQGAACDLAWRDRVISAARGVAQCAAPVSPLITVDETLQSIADGMGDHITTPVLLADATALADAVGSFRGDLDAIQAHNLQAWFTPGTVVALESHAAAYALHVANTGDLLTTALLTFTLSSNVQGTWSTYSVTLQPGAVITLPTPVTATQLGTYLLDAEVTAAEAPIVSRHAMGTFSVVDALLRIGNTTVTPPFVEYGSGADARVFADVLNVTNLPLSGVARLRVLLPDGTPVVTQTQPVQLSSTLAPLTQQLGQLETLGLLTGTYTVTLDILDATGTIIPKAQGQGLLAIGQAIEVQRTLSPTVVAPGDVTVTTTIETALSDDIVEHWLPGGTQSLRLAGAEADALAEPVPASQPVLSERGLPGLFTGATSVPFTYADPFALRPNGDGVLSGAVGILAVSGATSQFTATASQPADGSTPAVVTVLARDGSGNPVPGIEAWVVAGGSGNTVTPAHGATDALGVFTATVVSAQPEVKAVRVLLVEGQTGVWLPQQLIEFTGATVGGHVFSDANRDAVRQAGEVGLGSLQVRLYAAGETAPLKTTVTSSDGVYTFTDLPGGTYRLEQTPLDEYAFSGSGVLTVTVAAFGSAPGNDFGNYAIANVSGVVWNDSNQDGALQSGEPLLSGVTVRGLDGGGSPVDMAVTDADGAYALELAADLPVAPENFVFNSGGFVIQEPASAVLANGDFARGLTPLDAASYPGNYDFSSGNLGGWSVSDAGYVSVVSDTSNLDGYHLLLNGRQQWGISPAFTVTAETQALRFDYLAWTYRSNSETVPFDVYVLSGPGFGTSTSLGRYWNSFAAGWQTLALNLQAYQGQAIKLQFFAVDWDGGRNGRLRVDNVTLAQVTPEWTPSDPLYVGVVSDTQNLDGNHLLLSQRQQWAISSAFVVPEEAQALRFDYLAWTYRSNGETVPFEVYVLSGPDFSASANLGRYWGSYAQGWQTLSLDLQAYRGQTIKVQFFAADWDGWRNGLLRVDNVGLTVETPGWIPSSVLGVSIGIPFESSPVMQTEPDNADFQIGATLLPSMTYPLNHAFDQGLTLLDTATYPGNYDFSSGDLGGWSVSDAGYVSVVSDTSNLDGYHLLLNGRQQWGISPAFVVPAGTQALRFDYLAWTYRSNSETVPFDVYVLSGSGFSVSTSLGRYWNSYAAGWQTLALNLQAYQGQTIKVEFFAADWDGGRNGRLRVDNVTLAQVTPEWTPSDPLYVGVVSDTQNLDGNHLLLSQRQQWAISSAFVVPEEAQALRFDYLAWTYRNNGETIPFEVYVLSGPDSSVSANLGRYWGSYAQGWQTLSLDLQAYRGQTIKVQFFAADWDGGRNGLLRVDNVALTVAIPGWYPSDVQLVEIYAGSVPADPGVNAPDNPNFNRGRESLSPATYPLNYAFNQGLTPLDTATYPGNYDFSSGDLGGWSVSDAGYVSVVSDTLNLDGYHLLLNGRQQWAASPAFVVPAETQALRFNYLAWTARSTTETVPFDVYILSGPDFSVSTSLGRYWSSYATGWQMLTLNLQPYQGQTIKVEFFAADWDGGRNGRLRVDNLSLNVATPEWTPSDPLYVGVVSDTQNLDGNHLLLSQRQQWAVSSAFMVPDETQALRFNYLAWTARSASETAPFEVYVLSGPDFSASANLGRYWGSYAQGWQTLSLDLQAYRGQTIKVQFFAADWDGGRNGLLRVDNVGLTVETPGWVPSDAGAVYVASAQGIAGNYGYLSSYGQSITSVPFMVLTTTENLTFDYLAASGRSETETAPVIVYARSGENFATTTEIGRFWGSQSAGWQAASLSLAAFRGRVVRLQFSSDWDGGRNGRVKLDNLALTQGAGGPPAGSDANPGGAYLYLKGYGIGVTSIPFVVPDEAEMLDFDYRVWTARNATETAPLIVYVQNGEGYAVSTEISRLWSNALLGWRHASLDLTGFRGQAIRLYFATDWDGGRNGQAQLDNIAVLPQSAGGGGGVLPADPGGSYLYLYQVNATATSQPLTVPVGVPSVHLDYFVWTGRNSNETAPLRINVLSGSNFGTTTEVARLWSAYNQGWRAATVSLSAYQGQVIKLQFMNDWDGVRNGRSRVDNVYLMPLTTVPYTITETNPPNYTSSTSDTVPLVVYGGGNYTVNFGDFAVDRYHSTVEVSPATLTADGVTSAVVTVTVRSAGDAPLPGYTVALAAPGQAMTVIQPAGPTNAQGQAVGYLWSTYAPQTVLITARTVEDNVTLAQSVPVTFTPGLPDAAHSSLTVAPTSVIADGVAAATFVATLRDAYDNRIAGRDVAVTAGGAAVTLTYMLTRTNAAGQLSGEVRSSLAQTVTLTAVDVASGVTVTQRATVNFTGVDPAQSSVVVAPVSLVADNTSAAVLTVTLRDRNGLPVSGKPVALEILGVGCFVNGQPAIGQLSLGLSGPGGILTATLRATAPGVKQLHAYGDGVALTPTSVTFTVGAVNPLASQLQANVTSVVADGSDYATLTATLYDSYGHPVPGKTVYIQSTGVVTLSQPVLVTNAQGRVQATLRSAMVQQVTVSAVDVTDGVTLTQTVAVSFVSGAADALRSTVEISPTSLIANGTSQAVITLTLRDAQSHPLAGRTVQLVVTGSGNLVTPSTVRTTDGNGRALFYLASTAVETKQVSVREVATGVTIPGGAVQFVPGVPDPAACTLTANKTVVGADAVDYATVTATLYNPYGHRVPGQYVTIQSTGNVTLTQPFTLTNAQGEVQALISATQFQTVTVTAYDHTSAFTIPQTLTLTFVAGVPDLAHSVYTVTPTVAVADGAETVIVSATLQDRLGRPLANRLIALDVTGSGNLIAPSAQQLSDAQGAVQFTLAATHAETKTVTLRDTVTGGTLPAVVVTFTPGPVSAAASTLSASPLIAPADGVTPIALTARALDAQGNPVPGVTVVFTTGASGVTLTQPAAPSDANGYVYGSIVGTTYAPVVIGATADGLPLNATVTVSFRGPDLRLLMVGPANGVVGREVTYTLRVDNLGLLPTTAFTVTDTLPWQMSYVRDSASATVVRNGNQVRWVFGPLVPGEPMQFTLTALVGQAAPLNGQLTNSAQVTSAIPEHNTTNNQASATLTAVPGYMYKPLLLPEVQTSTVGAFVTYRVQVTNQGNFPDTYALSVNDLDSDWYTLEPAVLSLAPGARGEAVLTVHTADCADAGTHQFFVLVASTGLGNATTLAGQLGLVPAPFVSDLRPFHRAAIGSTSALFSWQTNVSATTELFIRPVGQVTYTAFTDAPGLLHRVTVDDLTRNVDYEWYARTVGSCGATETDPRLLSVLNGVAFPSRGYTFEVERDYNQLRTVTIRNVDTVSHSVVITIENPYPELIIGFVGDGSQDAPLLLQPGEQVAVQLAIHTQDVLQTDFDLVARLTTDDGEALPIEDAIPVHVYVHIPNFNFTLSEIDFNPQTLVRTYRLTNLGDPATDMAVTAETTGTGSIYLYPSMSHGYLQTGDSFTFEAIPVVDTGFQALTATLRAQAGTVMTSTTMTLTLPSGHGMYLGEAHDVSMQARSHDWYCTNRPIVDNRLVLPAGFRREDVVSARLLVNFSRNWTFNDVRPHDVHILLNNNSVADMYDVLPYGLHTFPIDAGFLNESLYEPSVNYIRLNTVHMNGGHYVVVYDMEVSVCLNQYREWVMASSQAEADAIVSGRSFLTPAPSVVDVDILAPAVEQTIVAGVPVQLRARVDDDIVQPFYYQVTAQADNGNGSLLLYDDGAHDDGDYRDGVYGGVWTPLNPGATTLTFHAGSCTLAGESQLTVTVRTVDFAVDVDHRVPLTGTSVLTEALSPAPAFVLEGGEGTEVLWATALSPVQQAVQHQCVQALPAMQPGEVREVAAGTVVSYTGMGGGARLTLSPLYVAARRLVAVAPATRTVDLGGPALYTVTLHNPTETPLALALSVAGVPPDWAQLETGVTLAPGELRALPLIIAVPDIAVAGGYTFTVVAETATGGRDQAGAGFAAGDTLELSVVPPRAGATNAQVVTYTATLTNPTGQPRTYALAVAGLAGSALTLPAPVAVAPGSAVTVTFPVTVHETLGPHVFSFDAVEVATGARSEQALQLWLWDDHRAAISLSPASGIGGPGAPVPYTVTVSNLGTVFDAYALSAEVPTGWQARFFQNAAPVDELELAPYLFNEAQVTLVITPALTAAVGTYPITVTAQSQSHPLATARASGALDVLAYGVQVTLQPRQTTLAPTAGGSWQVLVTNTGQHPDTYALSATGLWGETAEFTPDNVSLAPGQSRMVQLQAGPVPSALAMPYTFEVVARSLYDDRIQNQDRGLVTFTGYEAVQVAWSPVSRTLTDTLETRYLLVITNTGNLGAEYLLAVAAPGVQTTAEIDRVYIPAHMAAGILVRARAQAPGTYTLTVNVNSVTSFAADSAEALLIVADSVVAQPPLAVDDSLTTPEDTPVAISVLANDSDPNADPLAVLAITQPVSGTAAVSPDQMVVYTPTQDFNGVDTFAYTASDGLLTATATVTVLVTPVNDAPLAMGDVFTTSEDMPLRVDVVGNDTDVDDDPLVVAGVGAPAHGESALALDGQLVYTPTLNFYGPDWVTYTVSDGVLTATATVTLTVVEVNDPPTAVDDSALTGGDPVTLAVLDNDRDVDGDPLELLAVGMPLSGTVGLSGGGTLVYTPTLQVDAVDVFTYTVGDGRGGSAVGTVTITIHPGVRHLYLPLIFGSRPRKLYLPLLLRYAVP